MIITSVNNERIKYIKKLRNTKFKEQERLFIIEGEHLVKEAQNSGVLTLTLSTLDLDYGVENIMVTSRVLKSITNLSSVTNVIGICKYVEEKKELGNKIIILDGVQDPGNLGTIIRSACAFDFTSVVLSPNCVRKYNDKVIRATQGMFFKMNVVTQNISNLIESLKKKNYYVYGTDVTSGIDVKDVSNKTKVAVVMGSEGSGISEDLKGLISNNIYIKISEKCESLNVAVAASIIMHELR